MWDLTLGVGISSDYWRNSYVPAFAAYAGAGIRTADCLARGPCATDDFWKIKLGETFEKIQPDAIVTELGVNDAKLPGTATSPGYAFYDRKIDWFMHLIPSSESVIWTNLPCAIEPVQRRLGCRAVNDALAAASNRWSNLVVLNWAAIAETHPEYMDTVMPPADRVHYTEAGFEAWTRVVLHALDARFLVSTG